MVSDAGISLPPAMAPNLCIEKTFAFDCPTCVASFPTIGMEQMDSKQGFIAASDVQVDLQCATLISNATYTHSMTKVSLQCLCEFGHENFMPLDGPADV